MTVGMVCVKLRSRLCVVVVVVVVVIGGRYGWLWIGIVV